jgi:hypothetical protein
MGIINFGIYFLVKKLQKIAEIIFKPWKITGIGENSEKISRGRYEYDGSKESVWGLEMIIERLREKY